MTVADDLRAAKALIDTPEKWLKHRYRNESREAFCAIGAVDEAAKPETRLLCVYALEAALPARGTHDGMVSQYNDAPRRRHSDIMALFDRAISTSETTP